MEKQRHKLGVLGCGWIMRDVYTPIIQRLSAQVEVSALCDLKPENLQAAARNFPQARAYANPRELIESAGLDAVMVLTTERANARMATLALQAGLDVFLEKPPAISLEELDALLECETKTNVRLYPAFNRRHTPLLEGIDFRDSAQRVRGRMDRRGRVVDLFPYTAIHLIDSVQFYAGACFSEAEVLFDHSPSPHWSVQGAWADGTTCHLEFFPAGGGHCEYLVFEGDDYIWEIQFPNTASAFPRGQLLRTEKAAPSSAMCVPDVPGDNHEQMGYAPAFRKFVDALDGDDLPGAIWRLSHCRTTIAIMESLMRKPEKTVYLSLGNTRTGSVPAVPA
ncbi:MAG: Gfo/Idh/MocA family oxidoreductase [Opitutaceae bacterium]|jgi:virulence factor|nr:Gfo/Idh/MocA family oxidoreductase [Opitutaceae bacterium]